MIPIRPINSNSPRFGLIRSQLKTRRQRQRILHLCAMKMGVGHYRACRKMEKGMREWRRSMQGSLYLILDAAAELFNLEPKTDEGNKQQYATQRGCEASTTTHKHASFNTTV